MLNVAANYGGRWDIVNATQQIAEQVKSGALAVDEINEELINKAISLSDLPDVDLMIRTGGDYRISNFLLWQLAYAELYFTIHCGLTLMLKHFKLAIDVFSGKERRFGQTSAQVNK